MPTLRFAVIGDFGEQDNDFPMEGRVPEFVKDWNPDFIISLGDSAYSDHDSNQNAFERDVLKYYGDYIKSPTDDPSGRQTRFFPAIGNHDYHSGGEGIWPARWQAYQEAFAVPSGPGGHHYYEFVRGPAHFFVLDSNPVEKFKYIKKNSDQWKWLDERIAVATERWKFAFSITAPTPPRSTTKMTPGWISGDLKTVVSRRRSSAIPTSINAYERQLPLYHQWRRRECLRSGKVQRRPRHRRHLRQGSRRKARAW
jgi:hypothetical protein